MSLRQLSLWYLLSAAGNAAAFSGAPTSFVSRCSSPKMTTKTSILQPQIGSQFITSPPQHVYSSATPATFTTSTMIYSKAIKEKTDDDDENIILKENEQQQQQNWLKHATAAAVCAASLMMICLYPTESHAASIINNVSGGAIAVASGTNRLLVQLSETGFYQAFSLVFLSEIGDKTFFIAALLAMKASRLISFLGSILALTAMTLVSVLIGQIFHAVPSGLVSDGGIPLDDVAAVLAFAFFGFRTLKEAFEMDEDGSIMDEERAEAEETVDGSTTVKQSTAWAQVLSTFGLVFAAEFGDRSFLSTIALSAAQNPFSVGFGAVAAHAAATGLAVSGGSVVAKYISEKVIALLGGTLFLVFAVTTALGIF